MTVEEYLLEDKPFYHITPKKYKTGILENGLKSIDNKPICVVRSNDPELLILIAFRDLIGNDDKNFSVIKIIPSKHNLIKRNISKDRVIDKTHPIQNYILRQKLIINEEDFICDFVLPNHNECAKILINTNKKDFERLEEYEPRVDDSLYDEDNNFREDLF